MSDYQHAQSVEQFHRNCIYLDIPETVCGESVRNITPRLLARLTAVKSPWIVGGDRFSIDAVFTFIWALHVDYVAHPRSRFIAWLKSDKRRTAKQVLKSLYQRDLEECVSEIDSFVSLTYQDSLSDGEVEKPIAAGVAWLVYSFFEEPFNFDEDKTLDTPLRELYQLLRCRRKSKGGSVMNPSDKLRGDFIGMVDAWVKGDESDSNEQRRERLRELRAHYKQTLDDPQQEEAFLNSQFP